jgi:hypothetical protein
MASIALIARYVKIEKLLCRPFFFSGVGRGRLTENGKTLYGTGAQYSAFLEICSFSVRHFWPLAFLARSSASPIFSFTQGLKNLENMPIRIVFYGLRSYETT